MTIYAIDCSGSMAAADITKITAFLKKVDPAEILVAFDTLVRMKTTVKAFLADQTLRGGGGTLPECVRDEYPSANIVYFTDGWFPTNKIDSNMEFKIIGGDSIPPSLGGAKTSLL